MSQPEFTTNELIIATVARARAVQEWAFHMACMFEDCTYLSHEQFIEDARLALKNLVELVGQWTPPEIRDKKARANIPKCPRCDGPATHPSGLCRDCYQGKLESEEI